MLSELFVKNLTLIERLDLNFGPGLSVFTGETGAGKSILLDALMLIMGGRASIEAIREGAEELEVVARFDLEPGALAKANASLAELGLGPSDESCLILRKVVARHGRHKQYINGTPVTLAQLKEVAEPLIDFTGQHAQQVLLQPKGQLGLLDAFGGHERHLAQMASAFAELKALKVQRSQLSLDERTRLSRIDWLRFQIEEIAKVSPQEGEIETLKAEREQLAHAAKLKEESERARELLCDAEGGKDALAKVYEAANALQRAARHHAWFADQAKGLADAGSLIDDVVRELGRYTERLEMNPKRLVEVEDRLFDLQQLIRKHGSSLGDVIAAHVTMQTEVDQLQSAEEQLSALESKLALAQKRCQEVAAVLTHARQKAGEQFVKAVKKEVSDLGMPHAFFKVDVQPHADESKETQFNAMGADVVRLLFSANPGEQAHSLEKIASGGELSRVMLGIKRVLLTKDLTLVSIFDEVDAGVGGAMGEAIGEKLQKIAQGRQVLCVTHLAQVAARAHGHMKVEKQVSKGRTLSTVTQLSTEERIEELARMMGGRQVTEITRQHAREFLHSAQGALA